jgi:hypothetical protein
MPSLETVSNYFDFETNPALTTMHFPKLQYVLGDGLRISSCAAIESFSFPVLWKVGYLTIRVSLTYLLIHDLTQTVGLIHVYVCMKQSLPALVSIDVSSLNTSTNTVLLNQVDALVNIDSFYKLSSCGNFEISGAAALVSIAGLCGNGVYKEFRDIDIRSAEEVCCDAFTVCILFFLLLSVTINYALV